jgi:O-antigen/teichoic acid export membrane protein
MTITSAITIMGLADLGVGNGLISLVAAALGRGDLGRVRALVSSGWLTTWVSAVAIIAAFLLASPWISWARLLNARGALAVNEATPAVAAAIALLAVGMPAGIIQRVLSAKQEAFVGNVWIAVGSAVTILLTWAAAGLGLGLPAFVIAAFGGALLAQVFASLVEYGVRRPELRPSLACVSISHARELLSHGVLFFTMQVAIIAMSAADNIIIVQVLGPQAVTSFSVTGRLFIVAPMLLGAFLGPLWPAYADAFARADVGWIRRTLRKSIIIAIVTTTSLGGLAILLGPWLLTEWVGSTVGATVPLMVGLAAWSMTSSVASALSMVLNGLQIVRFQAVAALVVATATISAKTWVVGRWGLSAMPWAQVVVHGIVGLVPTAIVVRKALRGF